MLFVPGGWWHGVLNLTDTMAVTQNFMNTINFDKVWRSLRIDRKIFANFFLQNLRKKNPSLYSLAKNLNIKDNFIMHKDKTGKNFVEDYSTTTIYTSDSEESKESDYNSENGTSECPSESDDSSSTPSIEIQNQSNSDED